MSEENVKRVRQTFERFRTGDRESWRDVFAPDVIWDTSATTLPQAGVHEGHAGMERFFIDWLGTWENPILEMLEAIDAGDSVMVGFRWTARGKGSGVETNGTMFGVYDFEDGQVVRYRQYDSRQEALKAAGLSERRN